MSSSKEYDKKNYRQLLIKLKHNEYYVIDKLAAESGISKARLIFWAINYFIERGEIPPESFAPDIDEVL